MMSYEMSTHFLCTGYVLVKDILQSEQIIYRNQGNVHKKYIENSQESNVRKKCNKQMQRTCIDNACNMQRDS